MNISGPAAVAKPEMLFYAPGDLTVTLKTHERPRTLGYLRLFLKKRNDCKNH